MIGEATVTGDHRTAGGQGGDTSSSRMCAGSTESCLKPKEGRATSFRPSKGELRPPLDLTAGTERVQTRGLAVQRRSSASSPAVGVSPEGLRCATGGGNSIGGCNGLHIAQLDKRGTLCGLYGPATPIARVGERICGNCARIAKVERYV